MARVSGDGMTILPGLAGGCQRARGGRRARSSQGRCFRASSPPAVSSLRNPDMSTPILLARRDGLSIALLPAMANRHGLVAGATGTGKTVTLRVLAEAFSRRGVPVFLADVKGDLSGLGAPGGDNAKV